VSFLAASFAASGSLAAGFSSYFSELWGGPPALLVSLVFVAVLVLINYIGITESVVMNMVMTFVELSGLIIVIIIAIYYVAQGKAGLRDAHRHQRRGQPGAGVLAGVALSFFAMTASRTPPTWRGDHRPAQGFPALPRRRHDRGGVVYVLVSMAAALTVPTDQLAGSDVALLEVVKQGILPVLHDLMTTIFTVIALVAITNTTWSRSSRSRASSTAWPARTSVPGVFAKIHPTRAARGSACSSAASWCAPCSSPGRWSSRPAATSTSSTGSPWSPLSSSWQSTPSSS
jgi:amino acid transporter